MYPKQMEWHVIPVNTLQAGRHVYMRKSDLVETVADIADISKGQSDDAVSAMFEHMTNALARGEDITLVGFGSFAVKHRAARRGRNPKTGEEIMIAASNALQFKPGKYIKDALNNK